MRRLMVSGVVVLALVLVTGTATVLVARDDSYRVQILMPTADGTYTDAEVVMGGRNVGTVRRVTVQDGKALVTVALQDEYAPLHYGTTARITWEAVLSNRFLELMPGPKTNPAIPAGNRIESQVERVELDDVLAALDPKTLNNVNSVVQQLEQTLDGREKDLQATLRTSGPAVKALGEVLQAVGSDGPAIRDLVTQLRKVTNTLARRDEKLGGTVRNLGRFSSVTARQEEQLNAGLAELPSTLNAADRTLELVPTAVNETIPLLQDLRPATRQLPAVAANLSPVLQQLRPTVAQLRPTLGAASSLLRYAPGLLDGARGVLPPATRAVKRIQPAVAFLRPYTPELRGWYSNWTSIFAPEDATGNYARALVTESASSLGSNPGVIPPGLRRAGGGEPAPGSIVDQPWTDASGDGIR